MCTHKRNDAGENLSNSISMSFFLTIRNTQALKSTPITLLTALNRLSYSSSMQTQPRVYHLLALLLTAAFAVSSIGMALLSASPISATGLAAPGQVPVLPERPYTDGTLRRIYAPILMYHYVSPIPSDADDIRINLTVEPAIFRAHLDYLRSSGYVSVSLYEIDQALLNGAPLPSKPVVLTFDDGYLDHYTFVFPLLQEFGYTGTFFIITELADHRQPGHLTWEQIQTMAIAGMSMESHTKNHPDLRNRSYDFLVYEVAGSVESLAAHLSVTPRFFAYPVGRYDDTVLNFLPQTPLWRAVTTESGAYQTTDNHLLMPRVRISGNTSVAGLDSLLNTARILP